MVSPGYSVGPLRLICVVPPLSAELHPAQPVTAQPVYEGPE